MPRQEPRTSVRDAEAEWNALLAPLGESNMDALSPPMRRLVNALLLYKSMFVGPWFAALSQEEEPATRRLYERIRSETLDQARRAVALLERWDRFAQEDATKAVADHVLKRLLEDMLNLKRSSTEVFLSAGMKSPTEEMRREFLYLSDVDRRHAEVLREALGVHLPRDPSLSSPEKMYRGVHEGPFPAGTLSGRVREAIDEARASGQTPARLVLSNMALRHLRDEGAVAPHQGTIFGLPADIDPSWGGEAFTIASRGRVSLAEIVSEMEAGSHAAKSD